MSRYHTLRWINRWIISAALILFVCMPVQAAEFQWIDDSGAPHSLSEYKGQPLLLHFWASWCPPCRSELPELVAWRRQHPEVVLIPVSLDESPATGRQYLQQHQLQLAANSGDERMAMQLGVRGLPSTLVIAGNGEVKRRLLGAQAWGDETFSSSLLEELTNQALLTKTFMNKVTFRAHRMVRIKARLAGNGASLGKSRNAEPGHPVDSLRASRWAVIRGVAPACNKPRYWRALRLAADYPATR